MQAIRGYNRVERIGKRKYAGVKGFVVTHGQGPNALNDDDLYGETYGGISGDYAPICTKIQVQEYLTETKDLVLAYYETPRIEGKGTLYWRPHQMSRSREEGLDGLQLTGIDKDTGDRYGIVRGPDSFPETAGTFTLATAHKPGSTFLNEIWTRRDKVNSNVMPRFLSAPSYTLRYNTCKINPDGPNGLVYADHIFLYNPWGWNNWIRVQRFTKQLRSEVVLLPSGQPKVDKEGNVVTKAVLDWHPAQQSTKHETLDSSGNLVTYYTYEDEAPSARKLYGYMNFSMFDSMVEW